MTPPEEIPETRQRSERHVSFREEEPMGSASALLLDEMQLRGEIGDQEWEIPTSRGVGGSNHPSPAQEGQGMVQQTPSAVGHLSQVFEGSRPAAKEKVAPPKPNRIYSTRPGDLTPWKPAGKFTPQQWQQEQRRRQSEVDRLTHILLGQEQQRPRPTLHEHFMNEAEAENNPKNKEKIINCFSGARG